MTKYPCPVLRRATEVMSELADRLGLRTQAQNRAVRALPFFEEARLRPYGFAVAFCYAMLIVQLYRVGGWIVDQNGNPLYMDFSTTWVAGVQALRGDVARLYDAAQFPGIQASLLGVTDVSYQPNFPYPPIFELFAAPFAALPYFYAFLVWVWSTLLALIMVVYLIVRRPVAIALVLACPFTAWNFIAGQNGFLTGALLGGSLLCLERQPVLAGILIGCLSYKPQFGILLPVALIAGRQWRAFAGAAVTIAVLVGITIVAFGIDPWVMLPGAWLAQKTTVLSADTLSDANWTRLQTVYGLVRELYGSAFLAALVQFATTIGLVFLVWWVWRSSARYALKAATLAAAALIATPYAYIYDLAIVAVPVAFLADDQLHHGPLRGEQTTLLALFAVALASMVVFWGALPLGPLIVTALLVLVLRRIGWPTAEMNAYNPFASSNS